MAWNLELDLRRLDTLAYHRREYCEEDIRRFHQIVTKRGDDSVEPLARIHEWMLSPVTLWPFDIHGVFKTALDRIENNQPLDTELLGVLELLPECPTSPVSAVVSRHEHDVQNGVYEGFIKAEAKFEMSEKALLRNDDFTRDWDRVRATWNVAQFQDDKGVIRRTIGAERNLRPQFQVDWNEPSHRFQAAFDAFCTRWNLYPIFYSF